MIDTKDSTDDRREHAEEERKDGKKICLSNLCRELKAGRSWSQEDVTLN